MYKRLVVFMLLICGLVSCTGNNNNGNDSSSNSNNNMGSNPIALVGHKLHVLNANASDGAMFISANKDVDGAIYVPAGLKFYYKINAFGNNGEILPNYNNNIVWQSNNPAVASINGPNGFMVARTSGSTIITATDKTNKFPSVSKLLNVMNDNPDSLTITAPNMINLPINNQEQLDAIGDFDTLGDFDVTRSVIWTSSNEAIVHIVDDINSPGLIQAVSGNGSATITATWSYNDIVRTYSMVINVSNAKLQRIQIRPTQVLLNHSIPQGVSLNYNAIGYYDDGHVYDITKQVKWAADNHGRAPKVAISLGEGSISTLATGAVTITASLKNVAAQADLEVTNTQLTAIHIAPVKPIGQAALIKGSKLSFKATGIYANSASYDITSVVRWKSSKPSIIYVSNGKQGGMAIARNTSSAKLIITATKANIASNSYALVSDADDLKDVQISPNNQTLYKGIVQQYSALSYDSSGYMIDMTDSVSWNSQPNAMGSFSSKINGLFTPRQDGTANITARFAPNNKVKSQTISKVSKNYVIAVSIINEIESSLDKNIPIYLHAQAKLNNGVVIDITDSPLVTWTSSDTSIIDYAGANKGHFITKNNGTANITVVFNNPIDNSVESAQVSIAVNNLKVDLIRITPVSLDIPVNTNYKFNAVLSDVIVDYSLKSFGMIHWSSSDNNALSIDPVSGVAKAGSSPKNGVIITAKLLSDSSITAQATVNIVASKLQGVVITPAKLILEAGDSQTYQAYAIYTNPVIKRALTAPDQVHWSIISGDKSSAKINTNGRLIALAKGHVVVQAQLVNNGQLVTTQGAITTIPVDIIALNQDPLLSLEIIANDNQPLAIGEERAYKLIAHYTHHDDVNLDINNISWSSDNPDVATVNSLPKSYKFGSVRANSGGTANITATLINDLTKSVTTTVKVDSTMQPRDIFVVGAPQAIVGDTVNYYSYANYYTNGELAKSMVNMTNMVNWQTDPGAAAFGDPTSIYRNQMNIFATTGGVILDNNLLNQINVIAKFGSIVESYNSGYNTIVLPSTVSENLVISSVGTDIVHMGDTKDYHLKEIYNDIGNNDLTDATTWVVEDSSKASIDDHGRLTALSTGTTNILAYYNGREASNKAITILAKPTTNELNKVWLVDSLHNDGYKVDTPLTMLDKSVAKFYLMAEFNDGVVQKINPELVKWNSAVPTQVAFNQGRAVALNRGISNIALSATYTYNGQNMITPKVFVTVPAEKLTKLVINDAPDSLAENSTYNFSVKGYFGDQDTTGKILNTGIIWRVIDGDDSRNYRNVLNGKMFVSPARYLGYFKSIDLRAFSAGTSIQVESNFYVESGESAVLTSISIEPNSINFTKLNEQQHLKLMAHYANPDLDHYIDNSEVIWSTPTNSSIDVDMNGDAVALRRASGIITASYRGKSTQASVSASLTSQPTVEILTPSNSSTVMNSGYTISGSINGLSNGELGVYTINPGYEQLELCKITITTENNWSCPDVIKPSQGTGDQTIVAYFFQNSKTTLGQALQSKPVEYKLVAPAQVAIQIITPDNYTMEDGLKAFSIRGKGTPGALVSLNVTNLNTGVHTDLTGKNPIKVGNDTVWQTSYKIPGLTGNGDASYYLKATQSTGPGTLDTAVYFIVSWHAI